LKAERYLEQVRQTKTIPALIKKLISIFKEFNDDDYIPAIIEEGNFTSVHGDDFYLKLVLKHQSIDLGTTWLKDNMAFHLEEPTEVRNEVNNGAFIHNVVVHRRYKSRSIYQLNPLLVSESIDEYEVTNSIHINAFFNDEYSNIQGFPVLKSTNEVKLLVLKKVFNDFINDPNNNIFPKFELIAEFEYRTHENHFGKIERIYKKEDSYVKADKGDKSIVILGSVKIPLPKNEKIRKSRNVQVVDLGEFKPRKHNFNHFNGDTIEGFVCFRPDVINVLKEYYFFYDLQIVEKKNINNTYLIDVLGDKIVFWEAEYNKLPKEIKNKIDFYNYVPKDINGIISEAMSAMQLEVDWDWDKKLSPSLTLANLIREKVFNRALDIGLSFIEPQNMSDLKKFILKIESLTNVRLERFNQNSEEVKQLISIREGSEIKEALSDLNLLYQKYCYAIQMEYKK
jgi:hypothetical protein